MRVLDASDLSFPWHEPIPNVLTLSSPKPMCFHETSAGFYIEAPRRCSISGQRTDQCMEWMHPAHHHSDNAIRTVQWHMQLCLWSRSLKYFHFNVCKCRVRPADDLLLGAATSPILHRYILLLMQSRDSHLAPTGTSSPGARP